jgi:hypothetical protein
MRRKLLSLLAVAGLAMFAPKAKANTVTLYVSAANGTYQVYAADSFDNDGLANYELDVVGTGGITITPDVAAGPHNTPPAVNAGFTQAPGGLDQFYKDGTGAAGQGGNVGFAFSNSIGNVVGNDRTGITGEQPTVITYPNPSVDDTSYDEGVLVGVGQEPGPTLLNPATVPAGGTTYNNDYNTEIAPGPAITWSYITPGTLVNGTQPIGGTEIFSGYYSGTNGTISVAPTAGAYVETIGTADNGFNEYWDSGFSQPGDTPIALVVPGLVAVGTVPEPASIGLLTIGLGMIGAGRKLRRKVA